MRDHALQHAHAHRQKYLDQLVELLRIPSISATKENTADIQHAADWIAADMTRIGMQNVKVMPTKGNRVVYGEWLGAGASAPTILVYGHYDVQPVDPLELWETPPFEPVMRDGKIFARGSSDDKGQMFLNIKAVESMLASKSMPANVKMFFEGEEEIGSPNLAPFILEHKDLLSATTALISDGRIISPDQPSIVYALRGLTYMEFKIKGPKRDLHSGTYGGSVYNPAQLVADVISRMHDANGKVLIPHFYDKVRSISAEERASLAKVFATMEQWQEETGLKQPWGEPEYSLIERVSARPTCEVNGIWGGFQGEGSKTIIPAEAAAKVSMRLVADQDPEEVEQMFTDFVKGFVPEGYEIKVINHSNGWPVITPVDSKEMRAAARALETTWGKAPAFTREGGSIPVAATIQKELGASVVLLGFGLDDNVHAPNEHFLVDHYYKGIDTIINYYHNLVA